MTAWEYKTVPLNRTGAKEDFGFNWTYTPWEVEINPGVKRPLLLGLQELGRDGWELAGVLPNDLWAEGPRRSNASHGVRTISGLLLLKQPVTEASHQGTDKVDSETLATTGDAADLPDEQRGPDQPSLTAEEEPDDQVADSVRQPAQDQ